MPDVAARFDAWSAGESYDAYMGRWSRLLAPRFLDWLVPPTGLDWLEVGCGTGALTAAIAAHAAPRSFVATDASAGFVERARGAPGIRAALRVADAASPGVPDRSMDVVASGLVLNFLPDREGALAAWRRALRPGGLVALYVWDYPGGGMGFLSAFWRAAAALDPAAADLAEARRFPDCTRDGLLALASRAGLRDATCEAIEAETQFSDFEDLWRPFTLGAGPAPGYVASLSDGARARLRERLAADLGGAGPATLPARAWALRATSP